jgi:hypothetical protein
MIVEFAGLCSFFVLVILVQNTVSRRTKLRLLDLNQQYSAAKAALHEAMPSRENAHGSLVVSGAIEQSSGPVDGMLWTAAVEGESLLVLVVDPDGDGVDAAAVGLHVARSFEARRAERTGATPTLDEELRAIGAAAAAIPLARPVGALLLRVDVRSGAYEALCGSMAQLRTTNGQNVDAPELRPADGGPCEGILGPVLSATGTLAPGGLLLGVCTDPSKVDVKSFADSVARYVVRSAEARPAHDAAIWARGKTSALADRDIGVVVVGRGRRL